MYSVYKPVRRVYTIEPKHDGDQCVYASISGPDAVAAENSR